MERAIRAALLLLLFGASPALALSDAVADKDGLYPYVVQITFRKRMICSGTVLYPRIVITAAHCVTRVTDARARLFADDTLPLRQIAVATKTDGKIELHPVAEIVLPPQWREVVDEPGALARYGFDFALVITKQPIDVTRPALLAADIPHPPGGRAVMVGFGADNCSADARCGRAGIRRYREVTLRDTAECFNDALAVREPSARIDARIGSTLSLGVWCTDWGVMPGDSGGALLIEGADGKPALAGVISSHWGSYAPQVKKTEAEKRSFASSLYPSVDFIKEQARKLGEPN